MSYFLEAYAITMSHEGGYSFDEDDVGGETYKGVSRVYNPSWLGWEVIDGYKHFPDFPECLDKDDALQDLVKQVYKEKYFDPYRGDLMSNELALEMFDTSVNMGVGRAVKFLQISLNVLNRNQKLYQDQVADGDYGPTTHKCLTSYLQTDSEMLLCKIINVLQGNHYIEYMTKSPTQEKYARGWFNRVDITKR
jgi:lysozyme family protein